MGSWLGSSKSLNFFLCLKVSGVPPMLLDCVWGLVGFFRVFRLLALRVAVLLLLLILLLILLFSRDLFELFGVICGFPIIGLLDELFVLDRTGLAVGLKAKFDVI